MSNYSTFKIVSVQGETGIVSIDSSELPEGSNNFYYSDARVEANAVVSGSKAVTDKLTVTEATDLDDIKTKITTLTNGSQIDWHDHTKTFTYGENLAAGVPVMISGGLLYETSSDSLEEFIGITTQAGNASDEKQIAVNGNIAPFTGAVRNTFYYLTSSGTISSTQSASRIGKGIDTDKILIKEENITHILDTTIHYTEAEISIPSSQVTDIAANAQSKIADMFTGGNQTNITITYENDKLNFAVPEATTSGLGVASFPTSDFTVVSGSVSIKSNAGSGASKWAYGVTGNRPTPAASGATRYFDSTLGKPIWYYNGQWVDAQGNAV